MDNNLNKIALDLYGKIQTRFSDIKIGDKHGTVLTKKDDIPEARFFEFEYLRDGVSLGTISITLDQDDGILVQICGDLTTNKNKAAFRFLRSFRRFAKNRLLNFDVQHIGQNNLQKRYNFVSTRKEKPIMENKMFGTSKISYQDLGETRLIIKHSQSVNETVAAGRSMHIDKIYIENAEGERFRYPYKHLPGARALAEHIKHGGNPYDLIGKHITSLSEELNQLRKFKGYVSRQEQLSEAMGDINEQVGDRINDIKKHVQNLQRETYYKSFADSYEDTEEKMIPEDIMNDWVDRLTIRTFNEDLKSVFPYIYKLVGESAAPVKELSVDDLLDEGSRHSKQNWFPTLNAALEAEGLIDFWPFGQNISYGETARINYEDETGHPRVMVIYRNDTGMYERPVHYDTKSRPRKRKVLNPEKQFESFVEGLLNEDKDELFSNNLGARKRAIDKLNDILSRELLNGPDGITAIASLQGIIDDPAFIESLRHINPNLDVRAMIEKYVNYRDEDVAMQLNFGTGDSSAVGDQSLSAPPAPAPAPAPLAPPEAALPPEGELPPPPEGELPPPAPIAESSDKLAKIKAKFIKVRESGATLSTQFAEGMTLQDAIRECGLNPMECGFSEDDNESNGIQEVRDSIEGFWNEDGENGNGNYTIGGTAVKEKIKKKFRGGEYKHATIEDVKQVLAEIEEDDPSSDVHSQEHDDVMHLAGIKKHDGDSRLDKMTIMVRELQVNESDDLAQIRKYAGL